MCNVLGVLIPYYTYGVFCFIIFEICIAFHSCIKLRFMNINRKFYFMSVQFTFAWKVKYEDNTPEKICLNRGELVYYIFV